MSVAGTGRHFVVAGPGGRHFGLTWDSEDSVPAGSRVVEECGSHRDAEAAAEDLNRVAEVMES